MTAVAEAIPEVKPISGLTIRYTVPQDAEWLKRWLLDPRKIWKIPDTTQTEGGLLTGVE